MSGFPGHSSSTCFFCLFGIFILTLSLIFASGMLLSSTPNNPPTVLLSSLSYPHFRSFHPPRFLPFSFISPKKFLLTGDSCGSHSSTPTLPFPKLIFSQSRMFLSPSRFFIISSYNTIFIFLPPKISFSHMICSER